MGPVPRMLSPSMRIHPLRITSRLQLTVMMYLCSRSKDAMRSELPLVADMRPSSAAQYQLTEQILYSCARTFLERVHALKSRKAPHKAICAPCGQARRAVIACTIFKDVAQDCCTIWLPEALDHSAKETSKCQTRQRDGIFSVKPPPAACLGFMPSRSADAADLIPAGLGV